MKILIDEALVRQALDVVQCYAEHAQHTIIALRQALADAALDKMAENAKELGLDYGQPAPAQEREDSTCQEDDGCPTEKSVLQSFWRGQEIPKRHYPNWFLATPPAPAQPLTDEQIMEMYNEPRSDAEMIAFARAIEAAHGITKGNT